MRRLARSLGLLLAAAAVSTPAALAQSKATAENVPEIRMRSAPDFIKLPAGLYLGESMGVATNSQGHFWVFHRSGDTRLFEFDANGNFVKEWGAGLYGFSSRTRCGWIPSTTSGRWTRDPTW
jgi:hypothetical protein